MHRLVAKNVLRSSSGRVVPTTGRCSRAPLHLWESTPSTFQQRAVSKSLSFSTSVPAAAEDDLSGLSQRELEQLALKHARQAQPEKAQNILQHLQQTTEASEEGIAIIRSSVVDAWLEYQKQQSKLLQQELTLRHQEGIVGTVRDRVEYIHQAALAASGLVEGGLRPTSDDKKKVSTHHILAILRTWANASEAVRLAGLTTNKCARWSGIPQRAQHILDTHYGTSPPPTEAVNQVLKAWAYSGEYLRGTMAEQVFQKHLQMGTNASPDGESFRCMIRAWSWSKENRGAFTATGHYMRMLRLMENGQMDMEPTLDDYRILFQAWTCAEDKNAPSKVHAVLQLANSAYRKGSTNILPDLECYSHALQTMSRRVNVPEVGDLVDQTLSEMKRERMIIPNTECYGAAILAWKHVAMSRECDDREGAVHRCYDLLQEMVSAFYRTTVVAVRPTTAHYNHVLEALTVSKSAKSIHRAQLLLRDLERASEEALMVEDSGPHDSDSAYLDGHRVSRKGERRDLVPDADSYRFSLMTWRNSKSPEKVDAAQELHSRLKSRIEIMRRQSSEESIVNAMSAFISVCAKDNSSKDDVQKMETMLTTLRTLEAVREMSLTPNSTCYGALLEACNNLVQNGQDRQRILEYIFGRAADEGYVDQVVLENFKVAASTYLYAKMVVAPSQEVENMKVVPETWTRNVKGFSANNIGGRKVLPLTIEGRFAFTKGAAEYKMRKLRRQSNKKMLQGGRIKSPA